MTRSHRRVHRILWVVLTLALGLGIAAALLLRAQAHAEAPSTVEASI